MYDSPSVQPVFLNQKVLQLRGSSEILVALWLGLSGDGVP